MTDHLLLQDEAGPLISVILPVFNGEKYIDEAVRSVLAQTFTNFELIAINDGSTDSTLEILGRLQSEDERIIVVNRANKGLVETLNEGIAVAKGVWLARMDADDISVSHRFERQLQWLQETGADICGSWIKYFGTSDRRILQHPQSDEAIKVEMLFGSPFAHSTVLMKTKLVAKLGYDPAWNSCEDYDLWERAARAGWKMTNVPEVLLFYRQHESQISSIASARQQQSSHLIRCRCWEFMSDSIKIRPEWIGEVLALRHTPVPKIDMDRVDAAFATLLGRFHGESRSVIFHHMTRLYLRAAGNCGDIVARWARLHGRFGVGSPMGTRTELWFLRVFRIQPDTRIYEQFKKFYFLLQALMAKAKEKS